MKTCTNFKNDVKNAAYKILVLLLTNLAQFWFFCFVSLNRQRIANSPVPREQLYTGI